MSAGDSVLELAGKKVLVAGARVAGLSAARALQELGADVVVADQDQARLADLPPTVSGVTFDGAVREIATCALVVTSPGFRPDTPLFLAAEAAGVEVIGDVELAWRLDQEAVFGPTRNWLVVTGTNGKTTTTSMLEAILNGAGIHALACGNIGLGVLDAVRDPAAEVFAMELSSFQLFWAPSVRARAGVVLNIAEDHLDWHGSMAAYIAAKVRALAGDVAVIGWDDPVASTLRGTRADSLTLGFTLGQPAAGDFGVIDGYLVDPQGEVICGADEVSPRGPAGVADSLAAAALAAAVGVTAAQSGDALRAFRVGAHRATEIATADGVTYIDDSKATNPHAALGSLLAHERIVWLAGGLLKGASVDDLVCQVADRLVGVVLFGRDRGVIEAALTRHAPDVPVVSLPTGDDGAVSATDRANEVMSEAVTIAATFAALAPRPVAVVLAPAAASLDMFTSYGHRGDSFAAAVTSGQNR